MAVGTTHVNAGSSILSPANGRYCWLKGKDISFNTTNELNILYYRELRFQLTIIEVGWRISIENIAINFEGHIIHYSRWGYGHCHIIFGYDHGRSVFGHFCNFCNNNAKYLIINERSMKSDSHV